VQTLRERALGHRGPRPVGGGDGLLGPGLGQQPGELLAADAGEASPGRAAVVSRRLASTSTASPAG
jgi:hypothetical protein